MSVILKLQEQTSITYAMWCDITTLIITTGTETSFRADSENTGG